MVDGVKERVAIKCGIALASIALASIALVSIALGNIVPGSIALALHWAAVPVSKREEEGSKEKEG